MLEKKNLPVSRLYPHPCQSCGACCAFFRVSFYWRETEVSREGLNPVPRQMTEDLTPFTSCMLGTNKKTRIQCVALEGRVGQKVSCKIYDQRPTPCREFKPSYEDGKKSKKCDEARAGHGLRPLTRNDWSYDEETKADFV